MSAMGNAGIKQGRRLPSVYTYKHRKQTFIGISSIKKTLQQCFSMRCQQISISVHEYRVGQKYIPNCNCKIAVWHNQR